MHKIKPRTARKILSDLYLRSISFLVVSQNAVLCSKRLSAFLF